MRERGVGSPSGQRVNNSIGNDIRRSEYRGNDTSNASSPRSQAGNAPKVRVDTGKKQAQLPRGGNGVGSSGKTEQPSSSCTRRGGRKKKEWTYGF